MGYSLWGCKELDMTQQLTHTLSSVPYFLSSHFFCCFSDRQDCVSALLVVWSEDPALEFAGSWVEPGLGAKMRTTRRAHTDLYSLGSEVLC